MSIQTEINRVKAAIQAAYTAVSGKGGTVPASKTSANLAAAIQSIPLGTDTSDATAAAGDILSGKTAYVKGAKVTGTIAGKGAADLTASGAAVTVPAGYYPSQVSKSVATADQATPTASIDKTTGKVTASATQSAGYVAAGTKSGTLQLTTQAAATITPGTAAKTAVAADRYTTGAVTVAGDANLAAGNIKKGVSIFGVTGTVQEGVDTSDATAAAGDILSGKTAYVKGAKVTGTIAGKGAADLTASGAAVTVPAGYYPSQVSKSVSTATQATPSISVDSAGKITASATQGAGYVAAGTKSATQQLTTQAAKTVTPSTEEQTAVASGVYTTGAVKVAAMASAGAITGDLGTTSSAKWNTTGDTNRGSGKVSIKNVSQAAGYTAGYTSGTLTIDVPANRLLKGRTVTPTKTEQTIVNAEEIAYGAIKVAGDANLVAGNIKKGVSIFGVTGTMEGGVDTSDATAAAGDILSGKTAYVNGAKVTGTIPSKAAETITPGTTAKTAVSAGYYTTGAVKVAGDSNLKAANIKSGVSIFGVTGSYTGSGTTTLETYTVGITDTRTTKGIIAVNYQKSDGTFANARLTFSGNNTTAPIPQGFFAFVMTAAWSNVTATGGVSVFAEDSAKKTIVFKVTGDGTISIS